MNTARAYTTRKGACEGVDAFEMSQQGSRVDSMRVPSLNAGAEKPAESKKVTPRGNANSWRGWFALHVIGPEDAHLIRAREWAPVPVLHGPHHKQNGLVRMDPAVDEQLLFLRAPTSASAAAIFEQ